MGARLFHWQNRLNRAVTGATLPGLSRNVNSDSDKLIVSEYKIDQVNTGSEYSAKRVNVHITGRKRVQPM